MISYCHSDSAVCTLLYKELAKYGQQFDIWIDWKSSKTGYVWGKIADGIASSSVILCLLSTKYYESKSCQQEFVYAYDHLKKSVIPVYISDDKPPGWLGRYICYYIDNDFNMQSFGKEKTRGFMANFDLKYPQQKKIHITQQTFKTPSVGLNAHQQNPVLRISG